MTTLLVLLCQSTALLLLGFFALRVTQKRGPAMQTLVGRATLSGIALLLLLAPLTGHIRPVMRVGLPQKVQEPTPQQAVTLPPLLAGPRQRVQREDEEVKVEAIASETKTAAQPEIALPQDTGKAKGMAATPDAAGSPPAPPPSAIPNPSFRKDPVTEERGSKAVGLFPYLLIPCLLLLWLAVCRWHLARLRRTAAIVATGPAADLLAALTQNPPALLTHPSVHSPFLAGTRHPAIFLPPTYAADFNAAALRAILTHELAHRDHRDNLWTLAARLLTAVLWFQPLLWLLCRRLEQISEDACDEAVLLSNCPPRAYAACLLSLAERPPLPCRPRTLAAGVAPYRSSVGRRIARILATKGVPPMAPLTPRLRLFAAALSLAAALGSVFLISSAPAKTSTQAKPKYAAQQFVGRIVYENGQPASGVTVNAVMTMSSQGLFMHYHESETQGTGAETTSRGDGSYTLSGLRPGYHYTIVELEASGKWVASAIENIPLPNAVTHVPNLVLTHGAVIEGTVTNKKTGQPMPEMYVNSLGPRYPASMSGASMTQTDANGRYSLRVAPGDNWLYITGLGANAGYVSGQISVSPMSTNMKYPNYDHGSSVVIAKGEAKQVPIYAILPAPSVHH